VRGSGDDVAGPARVLMVVHDLHHLRVDARKDPDQDSRGHPREVFDPPPLDAGHDAVHQDVDGGIGGPLQPVPHVVYGVAGELPAREPAGLVDRATELEGARALHQRAIEIEEGRSALAGAAHRAAPRWRWEQPELAHTLTITASPWPPPEQIAAQP
jgi:hypothetical protein